MFSDNGSISIRQLQCLIILNMFGSMTMLLPRVTAKFYGSRGWVIIILATAIAAVYVGFIVRLCNRFGEMSFIEYVGEVMSKPIGILILAGFFLRFIIGAGLQLRIFSEVVIRNILNRTPAWIIGLTLIIACVYAVIGGYEVRARIGEILVFCVLLVTAIVFLFSIEQMDFSQILINNGYETSGLFNGIIFAILAFQGIEVLMFAKPYISKKGNFKIETQKAVILSGVLCTIATLLSIAYFGAEGVKDRWVAAIDMMNTVDFRFSFGQKQDIIIMGFWIASMFGVINFHLFFGSMICKKVLTKDFMATTLTAIFIFAVSLFPKDIASAYYCYDLYIKVSGIVFMIAIPILIYTVAVIRHKGVAKSEN